MKPIVYLAGPIAGLNYNVAVDWRIEAKRLLIDEGVHVLSPMREKRLLQGSTISHDCNSYANLGPLFTPGGIMTRDFTDVKRADVILANLKGAERPSVGTCMELAWAYAMQKPVVAWIETEGSVYDLHPMALTAIGSLREETLAEAAHLVLSVLGRG